MSGGEVRLRVTRKLSGSVDGIQLDRFSPGYVYLVGTTMGNYLMAIGAGVPVSEDTPALRLPPDNVMFGPQPIPEEPPASPDPPAELRSRTGAAPLTQAADRPRRTKRRR